jgi:hypothetical protein
MVPNSYMKSKILVLLFFLFCLVIAAPAAAEEASDPALDQPKAESLAAAQEASDPALDHPKADTLLIRKAIFGLGLHDTGPISDKNEDGVDANLELQFNRPKWNWWRWIGSPYTIAGVMVSFTGATSQLYTALNYEISLSTEWSDALTFNLTKTLFLSLAIGPAIHTGQLTKNEEHCRETGDCGFGTRVLPRLVAEFGTYFWKNHGISFFVDHMSGGKTFGGKQNEGVDHIGIRYHYVFNKN